MVVSTDPQRLERAVEQFGRPAADIAVTGAVKAVPAHGVILIPAGRHRVPVGVRRQAVVKGRVEHGYVGTSGQFRTCGSDAGEVTRQVQRRQFGQLVEGFGHGVVDQHR
jgi:hypothetical protein